MLVGEGVSKEKKFVYKGEKEKVMASYEEIAKQVELTYNAT